MSAVRHVVLLRFRPDVDESTRSAVVADLAELVAGLVRRSPGLLAGTVGRDLGLSDGALHAGLVLDAADADAWTAYQQHPDHARFVAERLAPLLAERAAVQFGIPSP